MGLNELGKIKFSLFKGQLIRAAVKKSTDPAHSTRLSINGLVAFALKFEHSQVRGDLIRRSFSPPFRWVGGKNYGRCHMAGKRLQAVRF